MGKKWYLILALTLWLSGIHGQHSTASEHVIVKEHEIYVPYSASYKTLRIYLPEGYNQSVEKYPVLYILDGQNIFDDATSYVGEWGVDEALDTLIPRSGIPIIMVAIDHSSVFRMQEFNVFEHDRLGPPYGALFTEFLVKDLKPHIDSTFRTLTSREHTGIMGSSLGGLMSFYTIMKYPDVFSKAGVYSPSFWISEEVYDLPNSCDRIDDIQIHMIFGTEEGPEMNQSFLNMEEILKVKMNPDLFMSKVVQGEKHSESFWRKAFPETYRFFYLAN